MGSGDSIRTWRRPQQVTARVIALSLGSQSLSRPAAAAAAAE